MPSSDAPAVVPPPLADVMFTLPQKTVAMLTERKINLFGLPTLTSAQAKGLTTSPPSPPELELPGADGKLYPYRPLETWLAPLDHAQVTCRRTGLRVLLPVGEHSAELLPFVDEQTARLAWQPHPEPESASLVGAVPLVVVHLGGLSAGDPLSARGLEIVLPFADDTQYGAVVAAMIDQTSRVTVEIDYAHQFSISDGSTAVDPTLHLTPQDDGGVQHRFDAERLKLRSDLEAREILTRDLRLKRAIDVVGHPHGIPEAEPVDPTLTAPFLHPDILHFPRFPFGPIGGKTPPADPPPPADPLPIDVVVLSSAKLSFKIPIDRPRDTQPSPYPDLPRGDAIAGWNPLPGTSVFFRPTAQGDVFSYLPPAYKLGFSAEDGGAARRPMAAELYVDHATGAQRVKATLVALPHIAPETRKALRDHICQSVLDNQMPFVQLIPAAGLTPTFVGDFAVDPAASGGGTTMPASIVFRWTELTAADRRLIFQFDMGASDYAIFCELVRHGIHGRLAFAELGPGLGADVILRLDDLIADTMSAQVDVLGLDPKLTLTNLLEYPVRLGPLQAFLVRRRADVSGMVLAALPVDLTAASDHPFAKAGEPGASFAVPLDVNLFDHWSDLALAFTGMHVDAGTPDAWLARVAREASLQTQDFTVNVALLGSTAAKQSAQSITLRLFRDGETQPRTTQIVLPSDPSVVVTIKMSLVDLMGTAGVGPLFSLEYYTTYADGPGTRLGLAQRVRIASDVGSMIIDLLAETPTSLYEVQYDDATGSHVAPLDAAAAAAKLVELRQAGLLWRLTAHEPAPAGTGVGTTPTGTGATTGTGTATTTTGTGTTGTGTGTGTTTGTATTPTGTPIAIVTSLLGDAFANGKLQQVFVVLKPVGEGAPTSTFSFDAGRQAQAVWTAPDGAPPFEFKITYLYDGGVVHQSKGTEVNPMLVLDPPPIA